MASGRRWCHLKADLAVVIGLSALFQIGHVEDERKSSKYFIVFIKETCAVYSQVTLSEEAGQRWLCRFYSENFNVKTLAVIMQRPGEIMAKIGENRHVTRHDIVEELNIQHQTVWNYLK